MAIRFPFFKLEALGIAPKSEACVVLTQQKRVCAATQSCLSAGVELNMPISTADVLIGCESKFRDVHKEDRLYEKVCDQLYAFTPYIKRYSPNPGDQHACQGLLLELSRSLKLFNGLENLIPLVISEVSKLGLVYYWATYKKPKSAWLLSSDDVKKNKKELLDLCCDCLDEFPSEAKSLKGMGFFLLGDIKRHIQREGLAGFRKRFSRIFLDYLEDVLDLDDDFFESEQKSLFSGYSSYCASIYHPTEHYVDVIDFDYPLGSIELLQDPIKTLLFRLGEYLLKHQKKCNGITWKFSDIYHNSELMSIRVGEVYRDWQFLYDLSLIKLEQKGLPFEVDYIELINPELEDASFQTGSFSFSSMKENPSDSKDLLRVVTKIQARIGEPNVFKVAYNDDHFPECSQKRLAVRENSNSTLKGEHLYAPRPGWILNSPVGIGLNQNDLRWKGRIELIRGPERIEGHWWGESSSRDYFVAVREDQARLWVFNDLHKNEWFVQGVF